MIVKAGDVSSYPEFTGIPEDELQKKFDALEVLIRKYTNNNFQNRAVRFTASSEGEILNGSSPFLQVGDTVQLSDSKVNDGLYVVIELNEGATKVDKQLFSVSSNLVTKIEYPIDVQQGVINLMLWEVENRSKVGVKSETLSRYAVTYFDQDKTNQVMGYPVSLLGFLEPYKKARF